MEVRDKLRLALERVDADDLDVRVGRIEWMAAHVVDVGSIAGPADTLFLLEEARVCFIDGHFIAAFLLGCAFIDHVIDDELRDCGFSKYESDVKKCRDEKLFDESLLDEIQALRKLRRGYVHRLTDGHPNRLHNRIRESKAHPKRIMEEDGRRAIVCMYRFHRATIR